MAFLHDINERQWVQQAAALLKQSRVQKGYFRYTQPSPAETGQQSPFHSALHAVIYRWFDADMASDELKSASAKQFEDGSDAGMIPHRAYWQAEETRWTRPDRSDIAALPLLAYGTVQVYHMTGDYSLLERMYPRLVAYHEWLDHRRDPDGDELISVIHPAESLSESLSINDRSDNLAIEARIREFGGDASALMHAESFAREYLDVNALRAADLEALAHIAEDMGQADNAARWKRRAEAVQQSVRVNLLETGLDRLTGLEKTPQEGDGSAQFIALFGGCATPEQAAAIIERYPRTAPYGIAYPIGGNRPLISMAVNWLIYVGLRRYGYKDLALELTEKCLRLVEKSGFCEFYDPQTGEGIGAQQFGASGLAIDMLFREKQARLPRPRCLQEIE